MIYRFLLSLAVLVLFSFGEKLHSCVDFDYENQNIHGCKFETEFEKIVNNASKSTDCFFDFEKIKESSFVTYLKVCPLSYYVSDKSQSRIDSICIYMGEAIKVVERFGDKNEIVNSLHLFKSNSSHKELMIFFMLSNYNVINEKYLIYKENPSNSGGFF